MMVDEIVTRQELIDAKRDAQDLGKAVNEVKIVSPRYGEDFKSLPMIAAEFQDAINTIVVDDGVPALAVSDASGVTQQEINDLTGAPYRVKAGGYNIGERVVLENGDIVKSTVTNNTNDPNVDMSGWIIAGNSGTVKSITELRNTRPAKTGEKVYLISVNPDQNKGGGYFIATQKSGLIDDGGLIISSPNPLIFWVRINYVAATPEMFGAYGDDINDDTVPIQKAASSPFNVVFSDGVTYKVTSTINVTTPLKRFSGKGIIKYYYEQSLSPSYTESLFYVNNADNVVFEDLKLQYMGTFNLGDYGGLISGIQVENSNHFTADSLEVFGFNRAGINIATLTVGSSYCLHPKISNCNIHHNRVGGVIFGNTDNGSVIGCSLSYNGIASSIGTGYGFAGWSANLPKNTILANNQASDNYRKGLDFHSGENGVLVGNVCARNRIYGIYVMGVIGSWSISANTVSDMLWGDEFPSVAPYGIRVGMVGQGQEGKSTSYIINANTISNLSKTAGQIFPIGEAMSGCTYGKLVISNNTIDVGTVTQIINSNNITGSGTAGNYYDVLVTGNYINATACDSSAPPIQFRSPINRQKIVTNNAINIGYSGSNLGVISHDSTALDSRCFIVTGNTINCPTSAWSSAYDPIYVRRVASEKILNNVVNGVSCRDWDGYKYIDRGNAVPTTNYWSRGSIIENTNPLAAGHIGWTCITAGTPGTWKTYGAIEA